MMSNRNNITIRTRQDGESSVWQTEGFLSKKGDVYSLIYPDYAGNTQTDNSLEIGPDRMVLERSGAFTGRMIFEENMVTRGTYSVMFFDTAIDVMTETYYIQEDEKRLKVSIEYQITEAGEEIARNTMEITVEK